MIQYLEGDCRQVLPTLPERSVQCVVTSPPYFGHRKYLGEHDGRKALEVGQETTPEEYVLTMVAVFHQVYRVLRNDGTLWLNLGDTYIKLGRKADAKRTFETYLELQPASKSAPYAQEMIKSLE